MFSLSFAPFNGATERMAGEEKRTCDVRNCEAKPYHEP